MLEGMPKGPGVGELTVRDGLDLGRGPHGLVGCETSLAVNEVSSKDGVDQCGLSKTSLP